MKLGEQIRRSFTDRFGVLGTAGFVVVVVAMQGISGGAMLWRYAGFTGSALMFVGEWLTARDATRRQREQEQASSKAVE